MLEHQDEVGGEEEIPEAHDAEVMGDVAENSQEDFNDVIFPDRKPYKHLGPADCRWPEKQPVTIIQLSRPTNHDGEAIQVSIPVFADDTDEDLKKRFHVIAKIGDTRFRENNKALLKAQEIDRENKRQAELAKVAHQAAIKETKKKAKLKPVTEG